ncbi:MAG: glycosyltransferase family 4 protein [Thermoguttaceae bacterium]
MAEKKRPRLIHIAGVPDTLWAFFGGQIAFMQRQGFEVHACTSPGEYCERFAARETIPVHPVMIRRYISPWQDLLALGRLWRLLRRLRPQIVHAHTPKAGLLGMLAAWLARVPVRIYTIHGLRLMTAAGFKRRVLRAAERLSCRLAHCVLCVGPSIRQVAVSEGLCPGAKAQVLLGGSCNGVDARRRFNPARITPQVRSALRAALGIPESALVIGFVGRVVRDKGIVELAAAWQRLRGDFPEAHLALVGPLEPEDPVPTQTLDRLRSDPRVHLAGMVPDASAYYAILDVCVLPSYREGLPYAPLEAAAMELPVVATRIAGCVDAVCEGLTGSLVPPGDVPALAAAIGRYLSDPALRRRHGRAGRQRVLRDFQPQALWEALCRQYEHLLREKGLPLPQPDHQAPGVLDPPQRKAA